MLVKFAWIQLHYPARVLGLCPSVFCFRSLVLLAEHYLLVHDALLNVVVGKLSEVVVEVHCGLLLDERQV